MTPQEIKKLRINLKLSQIELGKRAKIGRFQLGQYENGYRILNNEEIEKIKAVFKLEIKWRITQFEKLLEFLKGDN